jgi:hypothetical protein
MDLHPARRPAVLYRIEHITSKLAAGSGSLLITPNSFFKDSKPPALVGQVAAPHS